MEGTQIKITIVHKNLGLNCPEMSINTAKTISEIKNDMFKKFGTQPQDMVLKLLGGAEECIALQDDQLPLATYNVDPQQHSLMIEDMNPAFVDIFNDPEVKKYEISEDSYAKRDKNFRKFREQNL